jgi:Fe2+ or Zn2+ uptake regulation protein
MDDEDSVQLLAHEISRYLADRPDAVDTAEGILRWWLPQRGVETTVDTLRRALDALVEARVIERRELPDGRSVYGRGARADSGGARTDSGNSHT